MDDLRFVLDHNMFAYVGDPLEKHFMFKSMVEGLILSPLNYAIMEHPEIISKYIHSFWNLITECTDANGTVSLIGKVQGQPIIITEQILRECLRLGNKETVPVELDHELVQRTVYQLGHEGFYPHTEKKLLHPYWRYLAHVATQCLSGRKGGYDVLNQTLSSCLVAIALGVDFNYSKMIFRDMHANIKGNRKKRFLAFPRFIQIVINKHHQDLVPTIGTLGIKRMREDIFSYMMMNKWGKKQYVGECPLFRFGRFLRQDEEMEEQGIPSTFVAEEHDRDESVIPPIAKQEEIQDIDYVQTPETSPKKKKAKDDIQTDKGPETTEEDRELIFVLSDSLHHFHHTTQPKTPPTKPPPTKPPT
ncbi:hypothetical protein R6Q59_035892 [Mikania micrantha]